MKIVEVKHPLVKHKLGLMREHDISTKRFRELASEVGSLLTYEATADLETEKSSRSRARKLPLCLSCALASA